MRKLTLLSAFSAVLLLSVFVFFHFTPFAMDGVDVSSASCDDMDDIETIVASNWTSDTLAVTITEPENCAVSLQAAAVQRVGSHLFVRTEYASPSGMMTACHCRHSTTLRIPGLPHQTFQVHPYAWP